MAYKTTYAYLYANHYQTTDTYHHRQLEAQNEPFPKLDGGCTVLFIEVMPSGSKIWRYRYTLNGERQSPVTIGSYPEITRALGLSVYASGGLVQGTESLGYP